MRAFILGMVVTGLLSSAFLFFDYKTELSAQSAPKMNFGENLPANAFIELAKVMVPTVVNISTTSLPAMRRVPAPGYTQDPFFDLFQQFMGPMQRGPARPQQALGTGFIIRADGLILTNNHVVEDADVIKVQLSENDKVLYTAELIGRDKRTDLALIKIDAKNSLPVAKLGSSKDLQVGEWVAAFGNPLGLGHTTSKGIVSAIGREIGELNRIPFVQTDASINPGNSGGPLVNLKGEVIGVNTAIAANSQGIGFAIPIDEAKAVIKLLEKDGVIRHGYLGVGPYPYPIDPRTANEMKLNTTDGALIVNVVDGSPAESIGLQAYDFITRFDGKKVENAADLLKVLGDSQAGKAYSIEFIREGQTIKKTVTLATHPDDQARQVKKKKTYRGQKAPFDLGFSIANSNTELEREFGLPRLSRSLPVVIDIEPDSPAEKAGLGIGDVIVDVNRTSVQSEKDVLKGLKNKKINSLRVQRGPQALLLYLNPK